MTDQQDSPEVQRYMGPISSSLRPEADGHWVRYEDWWDMRHERNYWSWKHGIREEEIQGLREELPPSSPNYLAPFEEKP